jgi:hypothetical protein
LVRLTTLQCRNFGSRTAPILESASGQTGVYKDYAIVVRMVDPNTDQYVVVAAGVSRGGTVAAGEFLVDPKRMDEMLNLVPRWKLCSKPR